MEITVQKKTSFLFYILSKATKYCVSCQLPVNDRNNGWIIVCDLLFIIILFCTRKNNNISSLMDNILVTYSSKQEGGGLDLGDHEVKVEDTERD